MRMQGGTKRYSVRVKKEEAYDVLITEVKTVGGDANRDTFLKETNSLLIHYFVNCMTRLPNYFVRCLRGYYTILEKNRRSQCSLLLTTVMTLLRDFQEKILSASCMYLGTVLTFRNLASHI